MEQPLIHLFARHTKKTKNPEDGSRESGEFYQGITSEGEQLVREKTRETLLQDIEAVPANSVVIFSGVSDLQRTRSTMEVSVNELKQLLADRSDEYVVLEQADIQAMVDPARQSTREVLAEFVKQNPNKKVILCYPLVLKEFSIVTPEAGPGKDKLNWKTGGQKEEWTPGLTELMRQANNDENEAIKLWIQGHGVVKDESGAVHQIPNAVEVAQGYVKALRRLRQVAGELFPGRPLMIQDTSHSWSIDVFIAYATHHGKLDVASYEEIAKGSSDSGGIISEFEYPVIRLADTKATLEYRGRTYDLNSPEFNAVE